MRLAYERLNSVFQCVTEININAGASVGFLFPCHVERSRDISNYSPSMSSAKSLHLGFNVVMSFTFFCARPVLDLFLACDCIQRICAMLVIDHFVTTVLSGESRNCAATMPSYSAR